MSVEVQCPGCGRTYRTAEQFAGRRVKCKGCGAGMTVPTPAPAPAVAEPPPSFEESGPFETAPPPLPSAVHKPSLPPARPIYPISPPPPQESNTARIIVACVVGGLVLLLAGGGYGVYSAIKRIGGPAMGMSDSAVTSSLVGAWSGTQSHAGQPPVWGELALNADGTGRMRFSGKGKVADSDITWQVSNHMVRLTIEKVRVGNPASVGSSFIIGRVKAVNSTRLVMATQYGDELYVPSAKPGGQPPAGFPPIPNRGISAIANATNPQTFARSTGAPPAPLLPLPTPAGPLQDLLAHLDAGSATVAGEWQLADGTLTGTSRQGYGRLTLGRPPAQSFELQLTFSRTAGKKEFSVLFPAGRSPAELLIGGFNGQIIQLRGGATARNIRDTIVNGKDQTLDLTVRPQGTDVIIRVTLDDKPLLMWAGPAFRLRPGSDLPTASATMLGLAVHDGVTVQFKSARVRPLQGP